MPGIIELRHDYETTPDKLWKVATDWGSLEKAMKGLIKFYGLPKTEIYQGQEINAEFSLFGILPKSPWTMKVLEYNPELKRIKSHEYGGPVTQWNHTLTIEKTETGACLKDHIIVDAGKLTPIYKQWGIFMYKYRHKPRIEMLKKF